MSFLKRNLHLVLNKKYQPFTISEVDVPFHIQEIAKLYPVIHTVVNNSANGEVMKFIFETGKENKLRTGQAFLINEKGNTSAWIHLSEDFFKLVMKA